jgi:predicted Rossmann fold nucleotide-binding protein DprA/Smf involved in DNA uptake
MVLSEVIAVEALLASLYLRGGPHPPASRKRWRQVERAFRTRGAPLGGAPEALREQGLWAEAALADQPGRLAWGESLVLQGKALTSASPWYPCRWRASGSVAPPALWMRGEPPSRALLAVVGSRRVEEEVARFCGDVASEAAALGFAVVSGGAVGCDAAALSAPDADGLVLLPYGVDLHASDLPALSACAPSEPFSTPAAMERNALIYASAEAAVVGHSRFREGGTWTGATDALRRRLCRVLVRADGSPAQRALCALGAHALPSASLLADALAAPDHQPRLL